MSIEISAVSFRKCKKGKKEKKKRKGQYSKCTTNGKTSEKCPKKKEKKEVAMFGRKS